MRGALEEGRKVPVIVALAPRLPRQAPGCAERYSPAPACEADDERIVRDAWLRFKTAGCAAARDWLIIHYMNGHVRRIAQRLHAQLPRQVEIEDLVQQAYHGLVDVIERFDLERDIRFETFSSQRISGAMRDYLRAIDPVPRLTRAQSKRLQGVVERFQKQHGRAPDDDELRSATDIPEQKLQRMLAEGRPAMMLSYGGGAPDHRGGGWGGPRAGGGGGEDDGDAMHSFEETRLASPLREAERDDLRRWVTEGMSRRDRLIVILYYYEQMTMKEVGRTLGCSESRVSQRLDSIIKCLRARLNRVGGARELEPEA